MLSGMHAGPVTSLSFAPLVCLGLSGASFTEHDDIAPGAAHLGRPVWGPPALLANLELHLGLAATRVSEAVRLQRWARILEEHAATPRFYSASYAADRLGTAAMLLAMRDELVTAGWNGASVANGGERLASLASLEDRLDLPPGDGDRLRAVETELAATRARPFDRMLLAEPSEAWPGRWRRVFSLLAANGTSVEHAPTGFEPIDGDSDLAVVQRALGRRASSDAKLRGDGSFVLLRGETSWELATATASFLRATRDETAVVLRGGDIAALDGALVASGLGSQGLSSPSAWRPILQVLPLAIELSFEPRDPYRVLELLTLPSGPFDSFVGGSLARALERGPGIGGRPWKNAKEFIAHRARERKGEERATELLNLIEEWFERPGNPADGAPRDALAGVAARVIAWLRGVYARASIAEDPVRSALAGAALTQAQAFHDALLHDSRDALDLVEARLLLEQVCERHSLDLVEERAGRVPAADSPSLLRTERDTVVWWHCVAGTEWRMYPRAWRVEELDVLRAAGVDLADPKARLRSEAHAWRSVITSARRRAVLVVPRSALGEGLEPHPIVDEIVARLGLRERDLQRITVDARDLVNDGRWPSLQPLPIAEVPVLPLPPARTEWRVPSGTINRPKEYSATLIDEVLGCPLRSVLARSARIRPGSLGSVPSGHLLYGKLGHRVVEELHRRGALSTVDGIGASYDEIFDRLVREEAAVLTRPGMTFELAQLRAQLYRSLLALAAMISEARLDIVDVESRVVVEWRGGTLQGDIDLLLGGEDGRELVLDLKWGASTYRKRLESGRSIQLAVYVAARKASNQSVPLPRGAYFSLKQGSALATEPIVPSHRSVRGPSLALTWSRLERSLDVVETAVTEGRISVTGLSKSLPVLSSLGVPQEQSEHHLELPRESGCGFCAYDAVCGKRWEVAS
jgi:hypothetical protein